MINYNAALPAMALSGRRGIDVNQWINDVKGNLTALARSMFARGEQGIFLDPNDLTEEKIKWRRNIFTETEFRNGVSDMSVRGGTITKSTLSGFESAVLIEHGGASSSYAYKPYSVDTPVTLSFFVQMTDLSRPVLASASNDTKGDFAIILRGNLIPPADVNIIELPNNIYRMSASIGVGGVINHGVIKYTNHTQKSFKVSGYQLEVGTTATPYQPITDFNSDFIKQFPLHALYQDATGTVPVTAAGQPVGLMLDKSKGLVRGVERVDEQDLSKWASGGAYGNWPQTAATSDTVTNTSPSAYGARSRRFAINGGQAFEASALVKCLTADSVVITLVFGTAGGTYITEKPVPSTAKEFSKISLRTVAPDNAASCEIVIKVQGATGVTAQVKDITVKQVLGNQAYQTVSASRPILQQTPILGSELLANGDFSNGTAGWGTLYSTYEVIGNTLKVTSTGTVTTQTTTALPTSTKGKRVTVSCKYKNKSNSSIAVSITVWSGSQGTIGYVREGEKTAGSLSVSFDVPSNWSGVIILKLESWVANEYVTFYDVSVKEVTGYRPDQNYLAFDGVDDFLQTGNIDFAATDKVSLFAGVRKLSDAATGIVAELGSDINTNNGSFYLAAPLNAGTKGFALNAKGTTTGVAATSSNNISPVSAVIAGFADLRSTQLKLRVNTIVNTAAVSLGTGNYGNYPLYIGRRGGTSFPFNGNIYSLIIVGRLTTDSETNALEKSIAKNTGVTLNA